MNIYTAQYSYKGDDRIDITVKGNVYPGNVLAPTWEMVRPLQQGKLSQWDYTLKYFSLIINRFYLYSDSTRKSFTAIANNYETITMVCFCPSGEFCHRVLAARMLEEMGFGVYRGERVL